MVCKQYHMQSSKKVIIGLVVNTIAKSSRDIMLSVANRVQNDPYLDIKIFQGSPATKVGNLVRFAKDGIDGLMMSGFDNNLVMEFCKAAPDLPPIVFGLFSPLSDSEKKNLRNADVLVVDNEQIGACAADYLLKHALQNFGFLGITVRYQLEACRLRREAFFRRIKENSILSSDFLEISLGKSTANGDFWIEDGDRLEKWLSKLHLPCGIFVNGEMQAFALQKKCHEMGLRIPEQIEILCINQSLGFCETAYPTLSHIHVDFERAAKIAVDMLMSRICGEIAPEAVREERYLEHDLVERGSTAAGRGYGSIADRVKEFVRVHACEGIDVATVAKQLCVSRRTMEKRVREATGQSVLQLIRSVRLEKVCNLLATTDMRISDVTQAVGYQLTANLCIMFKKLFGMTMRDYRARARRLDVSKAVE